MEVLRWALRKLGVDVVVLPSETHNRSKLSPTRYRLCY